MLLSRPVSTQGKILAAPVLCVLIFGVGSLLGWAMESTAAGPEDFGRYLVDHQGDLAPFFAKNGTELLGQAVPILLEWLGRILLIALAAGWVADVLLGRGFAALFAPSLGTTQSALLYSTGRLALNAFLLVFLGLSLVASVGSFYLEGIIVFLVIVFGLISAGLQVAWISYLYRTNLTIAALFYLTLIVVHGFITLGVATPLCGLPASASAVAFMNQTVAPRMMAETRSVHQQLAALKPARDALADQTAQLQDQLDAAKEEQIQVQKQIDQARNSEGYLYTQVVKIHAQGNLAAARDQFVALLARFPNGPLTGLVQGQLTQVNSELAAADAQRREEMATKIRLAARAQATLLARADKGQATLSELRMALLGKSRADVRALFGSPSETASDRWGFDRPIVFNPLTDERSGLALYFSEGLVQSVDYYYGSEASK